MTVTILEQPLDRFNIAVFDIETTGLLPDRDHILQIALVHIRNGQLTGIQHEWKIDPGDQITIPQEVLRLTGLSEPELRAAPPLAEVFPQFHRAVGNAVLAGHNVKYFDLPFIRAAKRQLAIDTPRYYIDTLLLARRLRPAQPNHRLATCAREYGLSFDPGVLHDALADTRLCARLLLHQIKEMRDKGIVTFGDLINFLNQGWIPQRNGVARPALL
jgi:DNA polymerase III epsilon subunit family exonuclease